jgi:hypothetical protein
MEHAQNSSLSRKGIDTGVVQMMLGCRLFANMIRMPDGSLRQWFHPERTWFPVQLTLSKLKPDPRFREAPATSISEQFPMHSEAVYVGPEAELYGARGVITQVFTPQAKAVPPTPSAKAALGDAAWATTRLADTATIEVVFSPEHVDLMVSFRTSSNERRLLRG